MPLQTRTDLDVSCMRKCPVHQREMTASITEWHKAATPLVTDSSALRKAAGLWRLKKVRKLYTLYNSYYSSEKFSLKLVQYARISAGLPNKHNRPVPIGPELFAASRQSVIDLIHKITYLYAKISNISRTNTKLAKCCFQSIVCVWLTWFAIERCTIFEALDAYANSLFIDNE